MKCAAKAVIKNERYNFQHKKYGELFLDYSETAAVRAALAEYASLRDAREVQRMLDEISDWMIDAVTGAIPDSIRMRDGGRSWWAYDTEREDDAIRFVLSRWTMDFQAHGFRDVSLAQLEPGPVPAYSGWAEADVLAARAAREEYMAVRGREAIRMFTLCFCCWMAEQARGDKPRFSAERVDAKIYPVFAAEMRSFQVRFLSGSRGDYDAIRRRLAEMKRELEGRYGIVLGDVDHDDGGGAETKKDGRKVNPEAVKAFENLMKGAGGFASAVKYR